MPRDDEPVEAHTAPEDALTPAILAAVETLIAREGFEGATIRRVAAEAGCSAGAVQKRFASRAQLLRATFTSVIARGLARSAAGRPPEPKTLADDLRREARETLPLDAERRAEGVVWTSYVLRAATDDRLADLPCALDAAVHAALADDLAQAQRAGALRRDRLPGPLADALIALADGIAVRMLYTPQSRHAALLTALDTGIDALLAD